ncbi:MAG: DUF1998 domain-containing protein, partial [Dehalococcoidia bacterium]
RLANRGLLPMFGFPTRGRSLYYTRPASPRQLKTVDRDLTIAVSEFAPGSEIVKDKKVYQSAGVVSYVPQGPWMVPDPNPLGSVWRLGICPSCAATGPAESDELIACPVCNEPGYEVVETSQPKGFRTDYQQGRPYDWEFDTGTRAGQAQMSTSFQPQLEVQCHRTLLQGGKADVFVVNRGENGGGFDFQRVADGHGLVVKKALRNPNGIKVGGEIFNRVLLSRLTTDVLVLQVQRDEDLQGVTLDPRLVEIRAAWHSLAFLLRKAAALMLEVDQRELRTGIRPARDSNGGVTGEVFIADELENGAGYATYLGLPENFEGILGDVLNRDGGIVPQSHFEGGGVCDSSCYDCLRDYWNRSYHPLLDWRLGLDLARLAAGYRLEPEYNWPDLGQAMVEKFCQDFGGTVYDFAGLPGGEIDAVRFVAAHPLWDKKSPPRRLAEALAAAGRAAALVDYFELVRRPAIVYQRIMG